MVQVEVTGKRAQELLRAQARVNTTRSRTVTAPVEQSTDALVFVVRSKEDAMLVASFIGLGIPEGRGRFPIARLAEALAEKGYRLDKASYGDQKVSTIPATYRVNLMEMVGTKVYPRTGLVTGDQVREYHSGRGRASADAIASAAINAHGWGETYMSDSVRVERLD